jgi:hypothetical protein
MFYKWMSYVTCQISYLMSHERMNEKAASKKQHHESFLCA